MKRLIIISLACLMLFGLTVMAEAGQKNYGCGLGTLILGSDNDTIVLQTLALTTNSSTYTQLFGITSGTSMCDAPKGLVQNKRLFDFVSSNMELLASNIASGKGEALDTIAELIRVEDMKKPMVYSALKANFKGIFSSPDVEASEVINSIMGVVSAS